MKSRLVFSTTDVTSATQAVAIARKQGIAEGDLSLIARSDIQLERIPEQRTEARTDFMPAALRGAGYGGAAGLLAGLAATVIAPLGLTLAGVAATTLAGTLVGGWASSLMGAALPDPVRRKFEAEIEAGRVLVVIDGEDETLERARQALVAAGAVQLDYDAPSALS